MVDVEFTLGFEVEGGGFATMRFNGNFSFVAQRDISLGEGILFGYEDEASEFTVTEITHRWGDSKMFVHAENSEDEPPLNGKQITLLQREGFATA